MICKIIVDKFLNRPTFQFSLSLSFFLRLGLIYIEQLLAIATFTIHIYKWPLHFVRIGCVSAVRISLYETASIGENKIKLSWGNAKLASCVAARAGNSSALYGPVETRHRTEPCRSARLLFTIRNNDSIKLSMHLFDTPAKQVRLRITLHREWRMLWLW